MSFFPRVKKLFLYAGLDKEEFDSLTSNIYEENLSLLKVFSNIAGIMFFVLYIVSMLSTGFVTVNSMTYLVSGVLMLVIAFCAKYLTPKHPTLVTVFVYCFEIGLYAFSIRVSMLHAGSPAVSAVAFLLVSPLLFYDRPIRLSALIAVDVAVFCTMALRLKQPEIAETDVWNMVTFGIVAMLTTIFIMSTKFRAVAQSRQIEYMSQTDLLTGLKNRNHYDCQLQEYPNLCSSNLICVYGDVNGLHEVNNRHGHPTGDKMLKEVAATMQEYFGPEHTYRIGGDEFVAFRMDARPEDVVAEVERMRRVLSDKGYHVSFGIAVREKEQGPLDMHEMTKEAESGMFSSKRDFYSQPGHNRRSR
jgi:diguanylate cyclase (GGDEF)-like protein